LDVVANARELVLGSSQLLSTQTEFQTNERMKLLTFVTVVTGLFSSPGCPTAPFLKARGLWIRDLGIETGRRMYLGTGPGVMALRGLCQVVPCIAQLLVPTSVRVAPLKAGASTVDLRL